MSFLRFPQFHRLQRDMKPIIFPWKFIHFLLHTEVNFKCHFCESPKSVAPKDTWNLFPTTLKCVGSWKGSVEALALRSAKGQAPQSFEAIIIFEQLTVGSAKSSVQVYAHTSTDSARCPQMAPAAPRMLDLNTFCPWLQKSTKWAPEW